VIFGRQAGTQAAAYVKSQEWFEWIKGASLDEGRFFMPFVLF
jgi:hypothetical protein